MAFASNQETAISVQDSSLLPSRSKFYYLQASIIDKIVWVMYNK